MSKKGLGRGLDALLQGKGLEQLAADNTVQQIPLEELEPNPAQPRRNFDEAALAELADSIRENGIIQPLIVERRGEQFRIIAGERRYRAAGIAGLSAVPALVRDYEEDQRLQIALIENVQRQDLNPVEEARAYESLIERFGLTQDEVARRVGKSRPSVANALRMLRLPHEVLGALESGRISSGHARALLQVEDQSERARLLAAILDSGMSVRTAERLARGESSEADAADAGLGASTPGSVADVSAQRRRPDGEASGRGLETDLVASHSGELVLPDSPEALALRDLEGRILSRFGTRVQIRGSRERGRIEIGYFSADDLERILGLLLPDGGDTPSQ